MIYASPIPNLRDQVWENLESLADNMEKPWLVAGDFNDTVSLDESHSTANDNNASKRRKFGERINNCNLVDVGFTGSKFTGKNGRQGLANTKKRLDTALRNTEWRPTRNTDARKKT